MVKIYFNYKPLILSSEVTKEIDDYLHQGTTIFIDELNVHTVKTMIEQMHNPDITTGVFLHKSVEESLNAFKKELTLVKAAGGLVYAEPDHFLLIFRRGKWDLPKGKLDEGEELESCALREVQEETGLKSVKLHQLITVTYHTYHENGAFILKENHWYLMTAGELQKLVPQTDEDIEKCEWVPVKNLASYMENTLPSVLEVVQKGTALLHEEKKV